MGCLTALFSALLSFARKWSIRAQMLCFFSFALSFSLALIFALTLFNLFYLKGQTLQELEEATAMQAKEDLQHLVAEGAASLSSDFGAVFSMFAMLEGILATQEAVQGPELLPSYKYEELPKDCLRSVEGYGAEMVCFEHSSMTQVGTVTEEIVQLTSRLDYVLPSIVAINTQLVTRILLYFPSVSGALLRVFPGSKLPADYNVAEQVWYQDLQASGENLTGSTPYLDPFGSGSTLISHARKLRNADGQVIGVGIADTPVTALSRAQLNFTSFASAQAFAAAKDGTVVQLEGYPPLSLTNLSETDPTFWSSVLQQPTGIHSLAAEETLEVAYSPLGELSNPENWWYVLMVSVRQVELKRYSAPAKEDFERSMLWLLLATSGCALLTTVAVLLCVLAVERQVTRPLKGIVDFTNKVNATAASENAALAQELEDLEEGRSQVASLVSIYKSLMRSLLTTTREHSALRRPASDYAAYPLNQLYRGGASWKTQLSKLKAE